MSVTLICGDALSSLRHMPDESIQCCVTSPPYWGLRDYGVEGQLGLEPTVEDWTARLVEVFAEVRRVLRKDGTLWVNLGDCFGSGTRGHRTPTNRGKHGYWTNPAISLRNGSAGKQLLGLPWRFAFALQADGWVLRSDLIWEKPNPMPESVKDRPTRAHEYIFLFAQARHYYYDAKALAEPLAESTYERLEQPSFDTQTGGPKDGANPNRSARRALEHLKSKTRMPAGWDPEHHDTLTHNRPRRSSASGNKARKFGEAVGRTPSHLGRGVPWDPDATLTRNARSVWKMSTQPYPHAHFATFPQELARRCIVAGSRPGDVVLDPFGGSGTVAHVALGLGRSSIYIDLNPEYLRLAEQRIEPLLIERA